jgi:hypothetical protein
VAPTVDIAMAKQQVQERWTNFEAEATNLFSKRFHV